MGCGDRPRLGLAIGIDPAAGKPRRQIAPGIRHGALAVHLAQHRIHQAFEPRERAHFAHQRHRLAHCGVRRGSQKKKLAGAQPERVGHGAGLGRQAFGDEQVEGLVDLAQAAQRRGSQQAGKRPVARLEFGPPGIFLHGLVQGALVNQHRLKQVEGHGTGIGLGHDRLMPVGPASGNAKSRRPLARPAGTARSHCPKDPRRGSAGRQDL